MPTMPHDPISDAARSYFRCRSILFPMPLDPISDPESAAKGLTVW
jgi:hypothetical protein